MGVKQAENNTVLLDTSAQVGTGCDYQVVTEGKKSLLKRAKFKYLTNQIIFPLIDLNTELKPSYWRSYHCTNLLLQEGQKITTSYCNNRWCYVCNRIRTAKLINGYLPGLQSLVDPYFVTLTIPNVTAGQLKWAIDRMLMQFTRINKVLRKTDNGLTGIRKLESTYNPYRQDFHPHFHLIVDGIFKAQNLVNEWLGRYPLADAEAQDIRPADGRSLKELFKYFTKLVCKDGKVYPEALDVIFQSMYRRRVFQPFGNIKKQVSENVEDISGQIFSDIEYTLIEKVWKWEQDWTDWLDMETGELLTGYSPDIL